MKNHYVYFVQAGDEHGPIKIGNSADVEKRIQSLQTGNHLSLRTLSKFDLIAPHLAADFERSLHVAFGDLRMEGEWFKHDARILNLIESLQAIARREYECSACGCWYTDHGGEIAAMTSFHRQFMAQMDARTMEEAEQSARAGRRCSGNTYWTGQECGDRSLTGSSCDGSLALRADRVIDAPRALRVLESA